MDLQEYYEKREKNLIEAITKFYEERNVRELKRKFLDLLNVTNGEMEEFTRDGATSLCIYLEDRQDFEYCNDWDNDIERIKAGIEYLELVRMEDLEVLEDELIRA